ncbi:MAG: glycosyltransferase [Lachnospiraceae bacterium]|nr:glycosyltransferase [Lachnospiraceae bacterium]
MESIKPTVTIYILVYNNADELPATIESVMKQTYTDAEVILSDDGSQNYNVSILEQYAATLRKKYGQVRININEKNVGTVKHLNRVLKMAEGKYLLSCSSGDIFAKEDTVEKIVKVFEQKGTLLLTTRRMDVMPEKKKMRPSVLTGILLMYAPGILLDYMIRKKNVLSGCCTFYQKKLFESYGYFDERYHLVEDYPYYVMLLQKKVKFGWSSMVSIHHRMGGVSTGRVHPSIYKDIELMRSLLKKEG